MEQRLMKEDGELWFGEDGHMNNEADPVKRYFERTPQFFDPEAEYLQTLFAEPSLMQNATQSNPEKLFQLEIDIQSLKFRDHPLFIKEVFSLLLC